MRARGPERLFHLTEASNLDSIRRDGLLSTAALLERSGADAETRARVRGWRPEAVRLPDGVLIGDQWCQPPERLRRCLTGGLEPQDWYDRLNGFAYLWPSERAALRTPTPTPAGTSGCWCSTRGRCLQRIGRARL